MNDDSEKRRMFETCSVKGKNVVNPIVEWTDKNVWDFIKRYNVEYCELYDMGFSRLGCIGCPMAGTEHMLFEFKRYPYIYSLYIKAFDRMIEERMKDPVLAAKTDWRNGIECMAWWLDIKYDEFINIHNEIIGGLKNG